MFSDMMYMYDTDLGSVMLGGYGMGYGYGYPAMFSPYSSLSNSYLNSPSINSQPNTDVFLSRHKKDNTAEVLLTGGTIAAVGALIIGVLLKKPSGGARTILRNITSDAHSASHAVPVHTPSVASTASSAAPAPSVFTRTPAAPVRPAAAPTTPATGKPPVAPSKPAATVATTPAKPAAVTSVTPTTPTKPAAVTSTTSAADKPPVAPAKPTATTPASAVGSTASASAKPAPVTTHVHPAITELNDVDVAAKNYFDSIKPGRKEYLRDKLEFKDLNDADFNVKFEEYWELHKNEMVEDENSFIDFLAGRNQDKIQYSKSNKKYNDYSKEHLDYVRAYAKQKGYELVRTDLGEAIQYDLVKIQTPAPAANPVTPTPALVTSAKPAAMTSVTPTTPAKPAVAPTAPPVTPTPAAVTSAKPARVYEMEEGAERVYDRGLQNLQYGKIDEAVALFKQAEAAGYVAAKVELGFISENAGNFTQAVRYFIESIEAGDSSAYLTVRHLKGICDTQSGKIDSAVLNKAKAVISANSKGDVPVTARINIGSEDAARMEAAASTSKPTASVAEAPKGETLSKLTGDALERAEMEGEFVKIEDLPQEVQDYLKTVNGVVEVRRKPYFRADGIRLGDFYKPFNSEGWVVKSITVNTKGKIEYIN